MEHHLTTLLYQATIRGVSETKLIPSKAEANRTCHISVPK